MTGGGFARSRPRRERRLAGVDVRGDAYRALAALTVQERSNSGDVQLTWDGSYEIADAQLGLKGALLAYFDRALETEISARIMARGMSEKWFAGDKVGRHKFARYVPARASQPRSSSPRRDGSSTGLIAPKKW